jgi:hypothetical protein
MLLTHQVEERVHTPGEHCLGLPGELAKLKEKQSTLFSISNLRGKKKRRQMEKKKKIQNTHTPIFCFVAWLLWRKNNNNKKKNKK